MDKTVRKLVEQNVKVATQLQVFVKMDVILAGKDIFVKQVGSDASVHHVKLPRLIHYIHVSFLFFMILFYKGKFPFPVPVQTSLTIVCKQNIFSFS